MNKLSKIRREGEILPPFYYGHSFNNWEYGECVYHIIPINYFIRLLDDPNLNACGYVGEIGNSTYSSVVRMSVRIKFVGKLGMQSLKLIASQDLLKLISLPLKYISLALASILVLPKSFLRHLHTFPYSESITNFNQPTCNIKKTDMLTR